MRILFLLTQGLDNPSGQGRFGPIARELVRCGHTVELAMLHPNWSALSERSFDWKGVRANYVAPMHIKRLGNRKLYYGPVKLLMVTMRATLALSRVALTHPADIIHIAKAQPMNGLAGWLAKRLRGRLIFLDCDDYEGGSNRFGAGWQQSLVRWWEDHLPLVVSGVTVNTTFLQIRCERLGVPAARVQLVPNGFDPARFQPRSAAEQAAVRRRYGWQDEPVILYVGSMSLSSHPVLLLLDAFEQVHRKRPEARLWLVGGGEDFQLVGETIEARGLGGCIRLAGRIAQDEIHNIYATCDVTVDPVADDDVARARSPLKIVESLACGVPVVTGDIGDRARLLAHEQAGVLVEPGDASALAEGLLAALPRARPLSARARLIGDAYRWDELVQRFLAAYQFSPGV